MCQQQKTRSRTAEKLKKASCQLMTGTQSSLSRQSLNKSIMAVLTQVHEGINQEVIGVPTNQESAAGLKSAGKVMQVKGLYLKIML